MNPTHAIYTTTHTNQHSSESMHKLEDIDIIQRIISGNISNFEILMRRYNNRLFRIARSIFRDESDAMDIVQESWLTIYQSLHTFRGPNGFASWASRITHNNALMHLRKTSRIDYSSDLQDENNNLQSDCDDRIVQHEPLNQLARHQLNALLEQAIDRLPTIYRSVFVMRAVQQLNTQETANSLDLHIDTVKQRFLRGKRLLRDELSFHIEKSGLNLFEFAGHRCDAIVNNVFAKIPNN